MHLRFVAGSLQLRHLSSSVSARDLHLSLGILSPTSTDKHPRIAKNEGLLHWGAPEHSLSCTDRRKQSAGSTCSGLSALVRFPMPILSSSSGQTCEVCPLRKLRIGIGKCLSGTSHLGGLAADLPTEPGSTTALGKSFSSRSPPALFFTHLFS